MQIDFAFLKRIAQISVPFVEVQLRWEEPNGYAYYEN